MSVSSMYCRLPSAKQHLQYILQSRRKTTSVHTFTSACMTTSMVYTDNNLLGDKSINNIYLAFVVKEQSKKTVRPVGEKMLRNLPKS